MTFTVPGQGSVPLSIESVEGGRYTTDGTTLTISGLAGTSEATIGGVGSGPFASEGPEGGSLPYTCVGNRMTMTVPVMGTLALDRVDPLPGGDPITVQPGTIDAVSVDG